MSSEPPANNPKTTRLKNERMNPICSTRKGLPMSMSRPTKKNPIAAPKLRAAKAMLYWTTDAPLLCNRVGAQETST